MLITALLSVIAPHECIGCGAEGRLLCQACHRSLKPAVPRCCRCQTADSLGRTCSSCRHHSALYAAHPAVRYEAAAKDLVWKLKFGRAQAAADEIAAILYETVGEKLPEGALITHVPTATNRVRQRGYDQAALIARALAKKSGLRYIPLLARCTSSKQVGASRHVRSRQLQEAFRPLRTGRISGSNIVLVDDVITTGATLQVAANTLQAANAKHIEAMVFAQA